MNWLGRKVFGIDDSYRSLTEHIISFMSGGTPEFNDYGADLKKLKVAFSNPALLKVITLQCDLFSLGKFYVYKGEKQIEGDPILSMLESPNPFQSRSQFLWDYMFWKMLGNAYMYIDSKNVSDSNAMYFLSPDKITFSQDFVNASDKIVLSSASKKAIEELRITYKYNDNTDTKLKWGSILHVSDLTNGNGNWFKSNSRIDALSKVLSNSEASLDSKNINVRYAGKFMVAGKADPNNVSQLPMDEPEKQSIEQKMNGSKSVHAVKSMIEIKRFVENMAQLQLDEAYLADYFLIGSMYGIPKDVLEAYSSSTFENQEKARGAHVAYTLEPAGEDLTSRLSKRFGYDKKRLVISWDHLPYMQVFEKDRASTNQIKSQTILNLQKAGVTLEDINKMLDLDIKELNAISNVAEPTQQEPTAGASNTGQQGQVGAIA